MTVERIMSRSLVTVTLDDTLKVVKEIFDNARFHHLLVVEDGKLFGIISDRDLLKVLSPNIGTAAETAHDTAALNRKAHQIMTRHPVTLTPAATVHDAIDVFVDRGISCIPIVDKAERPVGILSWRDILKVIRANRGNATAARQGRT